MFWRKKPTMPQDKKKPSQAEPAPKGGGPARSKGTLLSLESRLMFDAAAAATAAEVNQEQVAQEQAEAAVSGDSSSETQESTASQDLLQAFTTYLPVESRQEIVFVDPTVPNYQDLLSGMDPTIEVVMLNGSQDGIEQMASALAARTGIDAIHVISHGDAGTLQLGTGTLTIDSMAGEYADELAVIKGALSEQADFLLYGCDFAEGDRGQAAVTQLAALTGADVQASSDLTGNVDFGGDWDLEFMVGAIETQIVVSDEAQINWKGLLAETWMDAATGTVIGGPVGDDWYVGDEANNAPVSSAGGADIMYGAGGDDTLTSGSGNDILVGGTGNDTISGGSDDDVILGGTGNDYLDGGSAVGQNTIIGGGGSDQMIGGSGADVFRFTGAQSGDVYTVNGGGATDIIDLSEFSTATITNSGGVITVDRGGGNVFTINHTNVETVITAATVGNHGPVAEGGPDQSVSTSSTVTLTAAGSSDQDGNTLTYQWTQIEGTKVTLSSSTAASPTFTAPSSATTLQFVVVVSDGTTRHADTVTINVGAANVAPTISNLSGDSLSYSEGDGAVVIDQGANALVADSDSANFDTGTLTISIPSGNVPTEDVLSIRNQGTGAGQIGVSGSNVTYGGVVIGTYTGGAGGNNLVVTFNNNATPTAVTALVKNITYEDINVDAPIAGALTIRFSLTDGDGGTSANYDTTVNVSGVNDAPVNVVPGAQSTNEDTTLVFSSGNGNQIAMTDPDASGGTFEVTISVTNGTLTLAGTTGLIFVTGDGTADTTMTVRGTVTDINNALNGSSFTPTSNYNGGATLSITTIDSTLVSLNLDANLQARYTFEGNANDVASGTAQNGTLMNGATYTTDATRGQVLSLDGVNDYVQITGTFSNPSEITIGGWVNLASGTGRREFISLSDHVHIALDDTSGVKGSVQVGAGSWIDLNSNQFIAGTGWHHVMYSYSDSTNTHTIYIDGVQVATATVASSIYWTGATDTYIGRHPTNGWYPNAQIDDVRIYNRVLTASEVSSLANDQNLDDSDTVAITVNAVNDAPVLADTALSITVAEDAGAPSGAVGSLISAFTGGITDVDSGASKGIAITATNETNGTWYYTTNGGTTWTAVGSVSTSSALLLADNASTRLYFSPGADYNGTVSNAITLRAWDQTSGSNGGRVSLPTNSNTVLDSMSSASFSSNNGTTNWSGSWIESDASGTGATVGSIDITSGYMRFRSTTVGNSIAREVDLTNATSATFSFSIPATFLTTGQVLVQVSSNGGSSYTTLETITSASATGTHSYDISSYMASNTRIRFYASVTDSSGIRIDDVQVQYNTVGGGSSAYSLVSDTASVVVTAVNDAPTITSLSGDSLAYNEGDGAVVIEQGGNALVADVDSTNFDTGTLTVSFTAGSDSAEDVLSIRNQGTSAGQIGVSGSTITYGGTTIGTFTGGSGGSNLVITLNSNATPTAVTALVKNITYQDTDTSAPTTGARTIRFALTDGDGGTSTNYDTTVTVSAVNDAPVLADTALSLTVAEDAGAPSGAVGSLVSAFTGGITDVDSGAVKGLAITGSNETNGTWYYTTNGGTTWTAVGSVSNTSALLLADNGSTRLYFAPSADYNGTSSAALTVRAWDQTSGTAGTKVTTASNGGTTAFSSATDTVDVTVTAVNDAPTDLSTGIELNTDGGNDAYLISDTGLSQSLTATTVEIRFAANNLPLETVLVSFNNPTGDELSIQLDDPSNNLELDFGSGSIVLASAIDYRAALVDGAVHTLSVTWDSTAGNWSVYIDGAHIESGTGLSAGAALDTTNGRFVFGQEQDAQDSGYDSTQYFSGTFYDVRIWNDVRTAGEISQYYQQQLDVTPAEAAAVGLVANWQMDGLDGSNQVVELVSGNNLSIAHASGTGFTAGTVQAQLSIAENSTNGSHVGFVTTEDSDANETFSYSLTDSAGGRFAVNSATGEITVANGTLLDYDTATSHSVTVRVTDSGGLTYDETFTINLTNVNETPTDLSLSSNTVAENAANGTTVGTVSGTDPDSGDTKTYSFTDSAGGRFTIDSSTGVITVADGSLLDYESATSHTITVRVTDAGGLTYDETFTINLTNANEAPTGADATVTINEDSSHILTTANFGFSDVDAGDSLSAVRIDTLPTAGTMTLSGVAVTAGQVITVADITAGNLVFTPAGNANGTGYASLTFSVRDSTNAYDAAPNTLTFNVTAVNDAPVITPIAPDVTFVEGGLPQVIDATGTITDVDSTNFDGGVMTVSISANGTADDRLSVGNWGTGPGQVGVSGSDVTYGGTVIGTVSGGTSGSDPLVITFNTSAPPSAVQEVYRSIQFNNVSDNPSTATRTLTIGLTDGDGGTATPQTKLVYVQGANDPPVLTFGEGDKNFTEGALAVMIDALPNVSDLDSTNFDTGTLTITISANPSVDDRVELLNTGMGAGQIGVSGTNVYYGGTLIGTQAGGIGAVPFVVTFNANADAAIVGEVMANIRFWVAGDAPSTATRTIEAVLTDGDGGTSLTASKQITVTAVNDTPTDLALSSNTVTENAANGTIIGTVTGTDPDSGDTKIYSFTDSAGGRFAINSSTGVITVANGSLLDYESAASHSVTVRVTDSGGLTYDETFTINLTNVNETPTDLSLSANTVAENAANGTLVGTVSGTDPDTGDTKTYSFTDSAGGRFAINSSTGVITVANSSLLNYEAATSHSVTVRVTDSGGLTYDETFTITVTNVNEAPTGADATVTIIEDTTHTFTTANFGFSDVDAGDSLSAVRIDTIPSVGNLTLSGAAVTAGQVVTVADIAAGHLVFSPVADANGTGYGSFTFSVRDSNNVYDTAPNTLSFDVTPVNDAPIAGDDSYTVQEDGVLTVDVTGGLLATDMEIDGDAISTILVSGPSYGTLNLNADGSFTYTPNADYVGSDSFTYRVTDGTLQSNLATVSLTVTAQNDAPMNTVPGAQTVAEDMPLALSGISVNDVDGNLNVVQLAVGNGTLTVSLSGGATISAGANGSGTLTLSGSQAQINAALATLTYQGALNFNGSDTLTVTSTDSNSVSDIDTVAITVTAVNDPTVVTGGTSGSGNEDTIITNTLIATDAEGLSDGTVFTVSANATNGTASIDPATGLWSYTPNADFNGTDSFTVTITDDAGNSSTQMISVTVTPVVDITNDSLTTSEDTAISANVLTGTNGATADSFEGTPTLTSVTQGANGSVTFLANGTVTYTPNANFHGTDSFTYTITSGTVTETATVTVTVTAVNDPTMVTGGTSGSGNEDTIITNTLTATDVEGLSDGTVFTVSGNATNGTASINPATGLWSYTPNADFNGSDSFTVMITDDAGNTSIQVISVTVTPVNDVPLLVANTGSTVAEGGTDTISSSELAVTDIEQAAAQLSYSISAGPLYGRLELTTAPGVSATTFTQADIAASRLIYIHDGSETTSDSFTFTVNDGAGGSLGPTTVTLTIIPVNDTPMISSDGGGAIASLNVAENVSAVTIVTGADVDLPAQALSYSISGGVDQALFTINTTTGDLSFTAPPDFEVATDANGDNVYVVQVRVVDSQGASTTQTIQVTVTDVVESVAPPPAVPPILLTPTPPPPSGGPTSGPGTPPTDEPATVSDPTTVPPGPTVPPMVGPPVSVVPLTLVPPSDRPVERVPEEPRKTEEDAKDRPLFFVNDDQGHPLYSVLPVEPAPTLEPEPPETTPSVSDLLMAKLDEMAVSLEQAVSQSQERHELMARVTAVTGTTLSVGFVAWALRSGAILASMLATMPAWQHFDPLPVVKLTRNERKHRRDEATRAQQEEAAEFKGLGRVLDEQPPLKRTA